MGIRVGERERRRGWGKVERRGKGREGTGWRIGLKKKTQNDYIIHVPVRKNAW